MNKFGILSAVAVMGVAPFTASAQWSDNFDSYAGGSINGLGGWQGWDNLAAAAGTVTAAVARSGPNSQFIVGAADSVHKYSGYTSGEWRYTAWQFIPQDFTGNTFMILNNVYNDAGPYNWAVQMKFEGATGLVLDDNGRPESPISFVRGQWAELRFDINLNTNTLSQYYNGALLNTGTWAPGGAIAIGGVDLFAETGSGVYYDDMSLTQIPAPASAGLLGFAGLVAFRRRRA